jgi:hypothetical protein
LADSSGNASCSSSARFLQQLGEVGVLGDDVADQDGREIGVLHHVSQLPGPVASVDRYRHGAEQLDGEKALHVVQAVGHQDADVVAPVDA